MSTSGGGYFRDKSDTRSFLKRVKDSQAQARKKEYETEIEGMISSLLSIYNSRDVDSVNAHLETIKKALGKDIDGTLDLLHGGSVAKHTYVDGLSDIDALVVLDKSELKDMKPEDVKEYFLQRLQERLPNTSIDIGTLAITIRFKDIEIQLLPAVRYKEGFKIADNTGRNWSFIKPNYIIAYNE